MVNLELVLFVIAAILFTFFLALLTLYYPIKNLYVLKRYVDFYGKQVYLIARDFDYYLINRTKIKVTDSGYVVCDHILFGDKFIYLINDRYYRGGLMAKEEDKSWVYYGKKSGRYMKQYVDNPLKLNDIRRNKISQVTGIDCSLFISIVLLNDDCYVSSFEGKSKDNFLVPLSKLRKTIKSIEKRDVMPMDEEQLKNAVQDIDKLNINKFPNVDSY